MAYIKKEQVAKFRAAIKAAFPTWKFSITREHYSSINVAIMEADMLLTEKKNDTVNVYWIEDTYAAKPEIAAALSKIYAICYEGNFNKSDLMTDYHHVGWYINIRIGQWDKPFKYVVNNASGKPVMAVTVKNFKS